MNGKNRVRQSRGDRIFGCVNGALLFIITAFTLYPLIFVVSASVSSPAAVNSGRMVLWPVEFTLQGYQFLLQYREIWTGYANTILYTVVGTLVNLIVTLPCAYGLSRRDIPLRNGIMIYFVITMYVSGGLIPGYMNISELGLLDSRLVMILPGAVAVYNLIVARTFFGSSIPWELHEAAFLDGCSDFHMFVKIILPLSAPIVAVMTLYYGVAHWNSYFSAMLYLTDRSKFPLQLFLHEVLNKGKFAEAALESGLEFTHEEMIAMTKNAETANLLKYTLIIASTIPMMIIYPFMQKFFNKGVMIGAVKG